MGAKKNVIPSEARNLIGTDDGIARACLPVGRSAQTASSQRQAKRFGYTFVMKTSTKTRVYDTIGIGCLYALLIVIPLFFVYPTFDIFELAKLTALRLITVALAGALGWKCLAERSERHPPPSPFPSREGEPYRCWRSLGTGTVVDWFIAAYLGVMTLATVFSRNPLISFFGDPGRGEGLLTILNYGAVYYLAAGFLSSITDKPARARLVRDLMLAAVGTAAAASVYGIAQRFGFDFFVWSGGGTDLTRAFSTFGNPLYMAAYLTLLLPVAVALFIEARSLLERLLLGAASAVMFTALVFTFSRAGWVGFAIAMAVLAIAAIARSTRITKSTRSTKSTRNDGIARACLPVGRSAETASSQRQTGNAVPKKISSQARGNQNKQTSSPSGRGRIEVGVPLAIVAGLVGYLFQIQFSFTTIGVSAVAWTMIAIAVTAHANNVPPLRGGNKRVGASCKSMDAPHPPTPLTACRQAGPQGRGNNKKTSLQASGNLNKKISSQGSGNLNKKISSQGSGNLNKKISSPFGGGRIKVGVPLAALVLVVLLVAGLAVYGTRDTASGPTESITARIGSMFDVSSAGFADRLSLWKSAVAMIKDRPILGWGPETFGTYFPGYRRMDLVEFERDVMMLDQPRYQNRPHSDILQQGVSAGVLGMLAYILMWAAVLWYATFGAAIKRLKHATHPLAPSSQGRGNLDKTSSQRQAKPDGIARACLPVGRSAETASSQRQTILPLALIAVGVVVLSYLSIKPLVADYYFDRGVSAFEASADAYGARDALESAITLNRNNSEYTNYGTVILTRAAVTSRDPDMASVYLVEAVQYGEDTLALNPDYPGYHYNLGNAEYYYSLLPGLAKSESDRALRTAVKEFETAVARDPLYLDYRMNLAMAYTAAGDTANAIEQLEYALRLKPGHPKATEKLKELKELKTKK